MAAKHCGYESEVLCNMGGVEAAMRRADVAWLSGWLAGAFPALERAAPPAGWVLLQVGRADPEQYWSDGSWRAWWRNRLDEDGYLTCPHPPADFGRLTVELHTGGTWYATEEELARLRDFDDGEGAGRGLATPGIERTNNMPLPVDKTAARVVGFRPNPA